MPSSQELNQFRRLIGDFNTHVVPDTVIVTYLNDATFEVTADFVAETTSAPSFDSAQGQAFTTVRPAPVNTFDELYIQFHPEVVVKAAINWWWQKASEYADRLTTTVGQASQQVSDKWTRAMTMIEMLEVRYERVQQLGINIQIGNFSYFDKRYLNRVGGIREEASLVRQEGGQPGDLWYG